MTPVAPVPTPDGRLVAYCLLVMVALFWAINNNPASANSLFIPPFLAYDPVMRCLAVITFLVLAMAAEKPGKTPA